MKDRIDPSRRQDNQQEMDSQTLESMLVCTKPQQEKKPKPQAEHALKCPRCDSSNTKFCYYNNYSLTQPRYFCKSCRRYWTQGGTLRNVPVGGGCRKNKRSSSSSSLSSNSSKIRTHIENQLDHHHHQPLCHLPPLTYDHSSHDLALALAKFQKQSSNGQMGFDDQDQISDTHMGIHLGNQIDQSSPMNFNNLYHNYGEMGYHVGNAGTIMGLNMGDHQEMTIPFEELRGGSAVSNGRELGEIVQHENHNRSVLWGFPWQFGDGNNSMGLDHIDARGSWNGIGSTWHGLLNSPLM